MDTPQRKIYRVRLFTAAKEEETSDNFLFDDSFDISNSLDSALYAGCELNNVTCTPIRSSTNLRTMEQTCVEAHVEELLNEVPAVNSEVTTVNRLCSPLSQLQRHLVLSLHNSGRLQ